MISVTKAHDYERSATAPSALLHRAPADIVYAPSLAIFKRRLKAADN